MSREFHNGTGRRQRTLFLGLIAAAFLAGVAVKNKNHFLHPDVHLPPEMLENLRQEDTGTTRENEYGFAVAHFLDNQNRRGMNVAPAIRQLADPGIRPDIAGEQLRFFLGMADNGNELSREERRGVAYVAERWPDRFDPYFTVGTNVPDTREELVQRLLNENPSLKGYLEPEETGSEIAARAT